MYNYIKIVIDYYEDIDNNKNDRILNLFAKNAEYVRNNQKFIGIFEITKFYEEDRTIANGRHVIKLIKTKNNIVKTKGKFLGILKSNLEVKVKFIDIFYFDNDKIIKRVTKFPKQSINI